MSHIIPKNSAAVTSDDDRPVATVAAVAEALSEVGYRIKTGADLLRLHQTLTPFLRELDCVISAASAPGRVCPLWCGFSHENDEARHHFRDAAQVELSLHASGPDGPARLGVEIEQPYGDPAAYVNLVAPGEAQMTVAETRRLRDALTAVLVAVDPEGETR